MEKNPQILLDLMPPTPKKDVVTKNPLKKASLE